MKRLLFVSVSVMLVAAACNHGSSAPQGQNQQTTSTSQGGQGSTGTTSSTVYENQYLKITVPAGWTAKLNSGAISIINGNYILYINTQASGVEGGRFAEIAMGAPSADAVVTQQPSPPCGALETSLAFLDLSRKDLYVSSQDKTDYCNVPSGSAAVWYFSYIAGPSGGYFNYYNTNGSGPAGYVITMAYNSKDVNQFPVKGSAELRNMLSQMTSIAQSLQIKQP